MGAASFLEYLRPRQRLSSNILWEFVHSFIYKYVISTDKRPEMSNMNELFARTQKTDLKQIVETFLVFVSCAHMQVAC